MKYFKSSSLLYTGHEHLLMVNSVHYLFYERVYSPTLGEPAHRLYGNALHMHPPTTNPFFNGSDIRQGEDGAKRLAPRRRVHLEPLRRDWVGGCGLKTDTSVRQQTRATFSH
jgi:hypothetical protein